MFNLNLIFSWSDKTIVQLCDKRSNLVTMARFELAQAYAHYPLKVACLPIPPHRHFDVAKLYKNGFHSNHSLKKV